MTARDLQGERHEPGAERAAAAADRQPDASRLMEFCVLLDKELFHRLL
jgi:hypothetical protein